MMIIHIFNEIYLLTKLKQEKKTTSLFSVSFWRCEEWAVCELSALVYSFAVLDDCGLTLGLGAYDLLRRPSSYSDFLLLIMVLHPTWPHLDLDWLRLSNLFKLKKIDPKVKLVTFPRPRWVNYSKFPKRQQTSKVPVLDIMVQKSRILILHVERIAKKQKSRILEF